MQLHEIKPLDPDSPAGRAASAAMTEILCSIADAIAARKRAAARLAASKAAA